MSANNALRDQLMEEFSPFSDIGGDTKVAESGGKFTIKMSRDGRPLKVVVDGATGKVQTTWGAATRNHASIGAALASEVFGNIKRWADAQMELLKRDAVSEKKLIPINGRLHSGERIADVARIDQIIDSRQRVDPSTEIFLIDGPAGIGKTNLIEQLALYRACNYRVTNKAPILHVKSRGRVLSNIQDLMAFSLQTLRSNITYDQVPVLARYGLIVIAIDGFDELGDPNGYELAWAQVGDLVNSVRGNGTIIMSGRDTFIGRERLIKDVPAIREASDTVNSLTLSVPTADQAKVWLRAHQWSDADFTSPSLSILLEEGSFALRPVFLRLLGENVKPKQIRESAVNFLVSMLVDHMIDRESKLFGKAVDSVLTRADLQKYVFNYMCEIAREMADSQTESLDSVTLSWISEASLGDGFPPEVVGLIKNRANVIAFLISDERPGYKKFINTHLMNFFLSHVTLDAIGNGEAPKYIRRNLLGSEFLSVFYDVAFEVNSKSPARVQRFLESAVFFPNRHTYFDRGLRNVGALVFSSLPFFTDRQEVAIKGFEIDECVVRGTSAEVHITDVVINQADCRKADLSATRFTNVNIINLIADEGTLLPFSFPLPSVLTDAKGVQITDPATIESWMDKRGRNQAETVSAGLATLKLAKHPIYKLLGRACRIRQYWLRAEDDIYGAKILLDKDWPLLKSVLDEHNFLREEIRQASGRPSAFVHIRQPDRILAEDPSDPEIVNFFRALSDRIK